ncbi:MAG: GGDEF domain-containing protein [Elusimicrobia bacterium]|nr:GGDEF domain-containing protein [Elusimicrobiota bacterium]
MNKGRFITLFVLTFLFSFISLLLLRYPEQSVAFFPLYGLLFLWADFRQEKEVQVIFLFLVTAAGLVLAGRMPGKVVAILMEMSGVWLFSLGLSRHARHLSGQEQYCQTELQTLDHTIEENHRDIQFYQRHQESLMAQTHVRREFVDAAQKLGATMNLEEIKSRLLTLLKEHYPKVKAQLVSGAPRDELESWVVRKKVPVMVQDLSTDSRFPHVQSSSFRSAVVVPLQVLRTVTGFLRLESEEPRVFQAEDLRTVDLLSTMASLSMENARLYERIQELAVHDGLTQLYTHRSFQNRLQEEILRAGRSQTPLSLIMGDVDHFKKYNDTYGHPAGDLVLKTVASVMSRYAREVDFIARYGGEEFALILPAMVRSKAVEFAECLRQKAQEESFVFQGQKTHITMSFGVSSFPQDATTASQLIRVADERMYRAKVNGRNQVVV